MSELKAASPSKANTEERLRAGERRFSRLEQRLDESDRMAQEHRQSQDERIADIAAAVGEIRENTQSIIETWNDGQRAVHLFCRLAQAWRFAWREVFVPVCVPVLFIYAGWYYAHFHSFPTWISDVYKLLVAIV